MQGAGIGIVLSQPPVSRIPCPQDKIMAQAETAKHHSPIPNDVDPAETAEWLESLDYVLERKGPERVQQFGRFPLIFFL